MTGNCGEKANEERGLAARLLERWRGRRGTKPRLELLDRIALAPRQSLALVEAEGRRLLVATSAEGAPAFYPLNGNAIGATRAKAGVEFGGRARIS